MAKVKAKKAEAPVAPIGTAAKAPEGFKVKRQVTMPTLSLKDAGQMRVLTFNEAMHESTYRDPDPKKQKEKPATIAAVTDAQSGEVFQFLVPSVVKSQLEREYPDNAYVTKTFQITCNGKRPSKRYRDFSIFEVEREAA